LRKNKGLRRQIIVCPGMHEPELTHEFLLGMRDSSGLDVNQWWVFPTERYPAYSGLHVWQFLRDRFSTIDFDSNQPTAIVFISFSAGVVGAIAAAHLWQASGGQVQALVAVDGWGVPLSGNFPIYRLSHDYFTHWSSALLGTGEENFYATLEVNHLELWRSPQTAVGYAVSSNTHFSVVTTAAQFIATSLSQQNTLFPGSSR
jgi:hypothetical protein